MYCYGFNAPTIMDFMLCLLQMNKKTIFKLDIIHHVHTELKFIVPV